MRYLLVILASLAISCSSISSRDSLTNKTSSTAKAKLVLPQVNTESLKTKNINNLNLKTNMNDDIPIEVNRQVLKWVLYFQGRGKKHMERYLSRSTKYAPIMKKILMENEMPTDLVNLALIESGFNPHAVSHANAVGYWQFMKWTGNHYGLTINSMLDERRDPVRSTRAAAKYLKALYNLFGDWYLAIAAYNSGENRIKRLVMKNYTRNFWELAKNKKLPRETQNYVPKFIAATLISNDPIKYGFTHIKQQAIYSADEISFNRPVSLSKLAKKMGLKASTMKNINPAVRGDIVSRSKNGLYYIKVPKTTKLLANKVIIEAVVSKRQIARAKDILIHRVRKGENLSSIAEKYSTSIRAIKRLNKLGRRSVIYSGSKLKIPGRKVKNQKLVNTDLKRSKKITKHKVKRGESLIRIARKYGVSLSSLRKANKLGRRSVIRTGSRLVIPSRRTTKLLHKVRSGESLIYLARKYNISLSKLARVNSLSAQSRIKIGEVLRIPKY